jgi:ABC-type cobalamin/Fe3+-siderophores transport system ATPase subunit
MTNVIDGSAVQVFREGTLVLGPSDFSIPRASITAVIGPNGSGKSTLLHAITGLLPVGAGSLTVLGGPRRALDPILPTFCST